MKYLKNDPINSSTADFIKSRGLMNSAVSRKRETAHNKASLLYANSAVNEAAVCMLPKLYIFLNKNRINSTKFVEFFCKIC